MLAGCELFSTLYPSLKQGCALNKYLCPIMLDFAFILAWFLKEKIKFDIGLLLDKTELSKIVKKLHDFYQLKYHGHFFVDTL